MENILIKVYFTPSLCIVIIIKTMLCNIILDNGRRHYTTITDKEFIFIGERLFCVESWRFTVIIFILFTVF